jgi:phenylpropionate dioxygenase-like ring-hydroxylating dioxygenase large terminal subunit
MRNPNEMLSDACARPMQPMSLPAWVYSHPEMTRLEIERILLPSWQIVTHANALKKSGDFATLDLGPESIFVIRDRDGAIHGFHNVCRHRGSRLVDGDGNCPTSVTCPYHGWSYRHDGGLIGMPARESFPNLDRSHYGLRRVKTDVAFGFVFVALGGDPRPVAETWGRLAEELRPYRFEEMIPLGPIYQEHWNVDWKIVMDNYLESYHVPIGHPGLTRLFTPDYDDQLGVPGIARGISWFREQPSPRWLERIYQQRVGEFVQHLPERERRCWRFYSMLPNLGIDIMPDQMDFFQVLPNGPGKAIIRGGVFGLPDDRREMRLMRFLSDRINRATNREDAWLCGRVQRGLQSSSYRPGPLSHIEKWMLEFHELLRAKIPEVNLPSAPARFA